MVQREARLLAPRVRLRRARIPPARRPTRLRGWTGGGGSRVRPAPAPDQRVPVARRAWSGRCSHDPSRPGLSPAALGHGGLHLLGGLRLGPPRARGLRRTVEASRLGRRRAQMNSGPRALEPAFPFFLGATGPTAGLARTPP